MEQYCLLVCSPALAHPDEHPGPLEVHSFLEAQCSWELAKPFRESKAHPFVMQSNISQCACTPLYSFVQRPFDCSQTEAIILKAAMNNGVLIIF